MVVIETILAECGDIELTDHGNWEVETAQYIPRISAALDVIQSIKPQFSSIPNAPFDFVPTPEQQLSYQLIIFGLSGVRVVDQLFDSVGLLWSEGRMVGISGLIRSSMEYWGAVYFALSILTQYEIDRNFGEASRRCGRLTVSGRTPVKLPWGGETANEPYSVMKFIKTLEKTYSGAADDYAYLCEATHPNFLQNSYFVMASKSYDNFSNDTFKAHAHEVLERTISALERTADGMAGDIPSLVTAGMKVFERA